MDKKQLENKIKRILHEKSQLEEQNGETLDAFEEITDLKMKLRALENDKESLI